MSHKMFGAQVGWTSTRAAGRAQPEIETSHRSPKPRLVRPQVVGKCCSGTPCYSWGYHELGSEVLRRDIPPSDIRMEMSPFAPFNVRGEVHGRRRAAPEQYRHPPPRRWASE